MWRRGVVVITTAELHWTKPELRFCAGSNPARGASEIRDGDDLWQWSRLEIRLNAFRRSVIPQKHLPHHHHHHHHHHNMSPNSKFCSEALVQRCSVKKVFLKILQITGKHLCQHLFYWAGNFIEKGILTQVFSWEYYEIFKNIFSYRTPPVAAFLLFSSKKRTIVFVENQILNACGLKEHWNLCSLPLVMSWCKVIYNLVSVGFRRKITSWVRHKNVLCTFKLGHLSIYNEIRIFFGSAIKIFL